MANKYSKCLVSANKRIGNKPSLQYFKDSYEEAEGVAGKIKELHDEGILFNHQGVLYRSSYISIPLQAALSKRNIPYQVFGGLKFYETAHVKDMMSHFKVIVNPRDELAWNRVLMLIEGIGPKTAEKISDEIMACSNFGDIIERVFSKYNNKKYKYSDDLKELESTLKTVNTQKLSVGEQFEIILEYYTSILENKYDDWNIRLNDLETLKQIADRYDSLEEMLADFAIEPPEKGIGRVDPSVPEEEKPLTLSTIHSAKGLEWEAVFFIVLMDGVLPVSFALNHQEEIEEEHRLFYVGITRAKNHLFLSMHHESSKGDSSQFNKLSRFIDVPNVLSRLEGTSDRKTRSKHLVTKETERIEPIYDKKSLLEKVIDFFK